MQSVITFLRRCPLTLGAIALAVAAMTAETLLRTAGGLASRDARHRVGAVAPRFDPEVPELAGPLALWEGEWWRIAASTLPHGSRLEGPAAMAAGWLWLAVNAGLLVALARAVETRMPRLMYAAFLMGAAFASMTPLYLLEEYPLGLGGVTCAVLGAALVLRRRGFPAAVPGKDGTLRTVADDLPDAVLVAGLMVVFAAVPLSRIDLAAIPVLACFAGLGWGALVGVIAFPARNHRARSDRLQAVYKIEGATSSTRPAEAGHYEPSRYGRRTGVGVRIASLFLALHIVLVPTVYFAVHPLWLGRYHWFLSRGESDPERRAELLRVSVAREPMLRGPWLELAEYHLQRGETERAWTTILEALRPRRAFAAAVDFAERLWSGFATPAERDAARAELVRVFGEDEPQWRQRLGIPLDDQPFAVVGGDGTPTGRRTPNAAPDPSRFSLDRAIDLDADFGAPPDPGPPSLEAPPVDPDSPDSAVLGRRG
ncbi:MAG: rhomboid family intramembrane serine protease [Planctomycetes bacterium]|nr:rhomboid family intramembrane serine protease [Planctomycetota bacterium]